MDGSGEESDFGLLWRKMGTEDKIELNRRAKEFLTNKINPDTSLKGSCNMCMRLFRSKEEEK